MLYMFLQLVNLLQIIDERPLKFFTLTHTSLTMGSNSHQTATDPVWILLLFICFTFLFTNIRWYGLCVQKETTPDMQPCFSEAGKHSPRVSNYDPSPGVERVGWDVCKRVTGHAAVIMTERVMDTAWTLWWQDDLRNLFCGLEMVMRELERGEVL